MSSRQIFASGEPVTYLDSLQGDLTRLDDKWNPKPHPLEHDPAGWIRQNTQEYLWSKQVEVAQSVCENRFTTVRSCHSTGKSFLASRLVAWWRDTKSDPFIVTTAPTGHQVKTILWREIKRAHKKANQPGKIMEGAIPEWKIDGEIVAFGRKPADYVSPEEAATAFQGIHAMHVLVILDEASGIPEWLANAVETLVTNERSRVLAIGNPDNPASWFEKTHRPGSGYNRIKIGWEDTPNYTGEQVPWQLKELLVSETWVEERKRRWGENSPMYQSKVNAEFPDVSDDTLFTPATIAIGIAIDRSAQALRVKDQYGGMDVARFGTDETVVYLNRGGHIRMEGRWAKADTMESVGRYRRLWENKPQPTVNIDASNVGAGVYDRLKELGYSVVPFFSSGKARNKDKFFNKRAEAYWEAMEAMQAGSVDIEELDEDLQAELMEVKWKATSTGKIQLEEKEETRKRLKRSPDRADAFIMSLQKSGDWVKQFADRPNITPTDGRQFKEMTDSDTGPAIPDNPMSGIQEETF